MCCMSPLPATAVKGSHDEGQPSTNLIKNRLIAHFLPKPPSPPMIVSTLCSVVQGYCPFTKAGLFICLSLVLHRGFGRYDGETQGKRELLLLLPELQDQAAGGQVRRRMHRRKSNCLLFIHPSPLQPLLHRKGSMCCRGDGLTEKIDGWSHSRLHNCQV